MSSSAGVLTVLQLVSIAAFESIESLSITRVLEGSSGLGYGSMHIF